MRNYNFAQQETNIMQEILFAGIGGQGIILSANILARSAAAQGLYACQSQSYGSESRGTVSRAEVVIDQGFIDFPHVEYADYFIAMAEPGLKMLQEKIKPHTIVLYDGSVFTPQGTLGKEMINVEATKISLDHLGRPLFANIVMLGALIKKSELLSFEDVAVELKQNVPPRAIEENLRALTLGYETV